MPYKFQTLKLKIPRHLDRRVKLTEADKEDIRRRYFERGEAVRAIARQYAGTCSRRTVQFVLFPERAEIASARYKARRLDGRYYNRQKHTKATREHRHYKQSIKNYLQSPVLST